MTYQRFLDLCKEADKDKFYSEFQLEWYDYNKLKTEPRLFVNWETGGMSGGSCWGSEAEPYTSNETEKEFVVLDKILTEIHPTITFLTYKALLSKLVNYGNDTRSEYYGNQTDYATKSIDIKELYDYLVEHKIIENE